MNLISTDISILQDMFVFSPYLFSCPLMVISGVYLLINKLGLRILAGLSIFLIFLFITTLLAKYNVKLRLKASTLTDQRIEKINEILNAIKLVKMFCWEKSSIKAVNKIRK
jgi:ATP-binding cassette subfamily C (CFTR/MRP) protein 1